MNARIKTASVLAAAVTALTGCAQHTGARTGKPAASPSVAGLPAGVVNATAVPSAVPNNAASRKNVTISACQAANQGWRASGTADNPGNDQTEYTVTVFFTTNGGTVIGTGQTTVAVKPGGHQPWNITAAFHPASDTRCVLRGVG
jgi:hypothetical protein